MPRSYLSKYYNVDNVFRIVSCVADVYIKMQSNSFLGFCVYNFDDSGEDKGSEICVECYCSGCKLMQADIILCGKFHHTSWQRKVYT